jgi:hypothetical protein
MQPAHYTPHMRGFLGALTAWLRNYEFVAIWLEGVALVAIFVLDWRERRDQRKERREQHRETAAQFDVSQRQVEAAKTSADAAIEAALASKKSAEISAALHRPFMGLSLVRLQAGGHGADLWVIVFVLKNFGTLPALDVGAAIEFFAGNTSFAKINEPTSVQIFPSAETQIIAQQMIAKRVEIQTGAEKLRINVRIPYIAEDGRHFEHTAEVSYNHQLNAFDIDKSETHLH